jgi:hypothetical protein
VERLSADVDRGQPSARLLLVVYGAAVAVLALVALINLADERSFGFLTRDPAYAVRLEGCGGSSCSYAGLLSQLGVILTTGTAVVAALAARLAPPGSDVRRMLGAAAALTALVFVDDAFLLHDGLFDALHPAGQRATLLALGCAAGLFLYAFRGQVAKTPFAILYVAAVAFGMSLAVDQAFEDPPRLLEDGAKFIGLVSWSLWVALVAGPFLRPGNASRTAAVPGA